MHVTVIKALPEPPRQVRWAVLNSVDFWRGVFSSRDYSRSLVSHVAAHFLSGPCRLGGRRVPPPPACNASQVTRCKTCPLSAGQVESGSSRRIRALVLAPAPRYAVGNLTWACACASLCV